MFVKLRRDMKRSAGLRPGHADGIRRIRRVVFYMVLYPFAYLILSLPLAVGRMISVGGHDPSLAYFCTAGAMMTSSGIVDSIMYTLTRRILLTEMDISNDPRRGLYSRGASRGPFNTDASGRHHITVSAHPYAKTAHRVSSHEKGLLYYGSRPDSTEQMVSHPETELRSLGKVYQHTTIEITHEAASPLGLESDQDSGRQ
jgi:hypothetical protein